MNNYIFIPSKDKQIKTLSSLGFNFFILPLENYSIGFDNYYDLKTINKFASKYNIYVIINKVLHSKEIESVKEVLKDFKNVKGFFIEDKGLLEIIRKEKIIVNERTMTTNYKTINLYESLNINNIVISNDIKIDEIKEIRKKTKANLYYYLINKNILLYSKRKLISNYYKNYKIKSKKDYLNIEESKTKHKLNIKEEDDSTIILNGKVFSGYKYLNELKEYINYFIINLNNLTKEEIDEIILGVSGENVTLDSFDYFLDNEIKVKVGDDK